MLGETFEFVTKDLKYLSERVQHYPEDIDAFYLEGKHYKHYGYN